jgi:hypothetical protein
MPLRRNIALFESAQLTRLIDKQRHNLTGEIADEHRPVAYPHRSDPHGIDMARIGRGRRPSPDLADSARKLNDQDVSTSSRTTVPARCRPRRASRSSFLGRPTGLRTLGMAS